MLDSLWLPYSTVVETDEKLVDLEARGQEYEEREQSKIRNQGSVQKWNILLGWSLPRLEEFPLEQMGSGTLPSSFTEVSGEEDWQSGAHGLCHSYCLQPRQSNLVYVQRVLVQARAGVPLRRTRGLSRPVVPISALGTYVARLC